MSDIQVTPDELPKEKVAKAVISAKRKYFLPDHNLVIEAESVEDAIAIHKKTLKVKDGDGL